jgi:zinc protease
MQTEIARLTAEPVPADFLPTRQSVLTGAFARKLETNAGYAEQFGEFALYDLPLERLNHYADLQTFAAKHLTSDAFTVVIAGQAKIIAQPLRAAFPKLEVIPLSRLDLDSPALRAAAKR